MDFKKILNKILEIALGLLAGIGLTLVYERNFVKINGNENIVNIYTVCNNDTVILWQTERLTSYDKKGREMDFFIAYLSAEKRWKKGSWEFFENDEKFENSFPSYLRKLEMIDSSISLVAVGLASEEGQDINQEYARADKRADKIIENLRLIVDPQKNLYKLNLGKHNVTKNEETSAQRRVIIIGIIKQDEGMGISDIEFALHEKLKKEMKQKIGLDIREYSDFTLTNPY